MNPNRWNRFLFSVLMAPEGGDGGSGGGGAGDGGAGGGGGGGGGDAGGGTGKSILGGDPGGGAKPWYDGLPDDLKASPYVAQTKDLAAFVKSAVDTKGLVGANTIKLPGEKATEQELADFYSKLGRPAEATGYTPTVAPKAEHLVDKNVMSTMQEQFHKLGLTAAQGQGVLDSYLGLLNTGYEAQTAQLEADYSGGVAKLKQEWSTNYDNNVKIAQGALRQFGSPELIAKIDELGLGNNTDFIKFMHGIGVQLLDDEAIGGGDGGQFGGTPMAAQQEIERLKVDKEFQEALNSVNHAGHKAAVDRWRALFEKAYPGKQTD